MSSEDDELNTRMIHAGRSATRFGGTVNPPIQRASTILAPNMDGLYGGTKSLYARMGTSVHESLAEGLCALENASHTQLAANGLNACSLALASVLNAGDHLIASDSIYGPTRRFCEKFLSRMGVQTSFIHPRTSADELEALLRENTRGIFLEMPGSLTFELHDIKGITKLARERDLITILDNTWAAGVFFKPLDHDVDISVQALTKYVIGHSDGFGGAVMTKRKDLANKIKSTAEEWGITMSPDDAYLAQRGLRSLALRMNSQGEAALDLARFLEAHPAIERVFHPGLASHEDHDIWTSCFSGAAGLFSFTLKPVSDDALKRFFGALTLFGFGFSWGGFESLMIYCDPQLRRTESPEWAADAHGPLIRVSVGLEDPNDLQADLEQALASL